MQSRFFGLTETNVRKLAYQLAMKNDIITPFDHKKKMAGKKWLENFLKRHKNLSIRTPEATSMGPAVTFNNFGETIKERLHSIKYIQYGRKWYYGCPQAT